MAYPMTMGTKNRRVNESKLIAEFALQEIVRSDTWVGNRKVRGRKQVCKKESAKRQQGVKQHLR